MVSSARQMLLISNAFTSRQMDAIINHQSHGKRSPDVIIGLRGRGYV